MARSVLVAAALALVSYVVTWTKTSATRIGGPSCLLTIVKRGELRIVTGMWTTNGVAHWRFGRAFAATKSYPPPEAANVRLLADGRMTKIYRR